MRKISSLCGKHAISASNGEYLGAITGVLCDKSLKTVEYLNILKSSDTLDDYCFAAPRSIKSIFDESVVLTNNLCIKNSAEIKCDAVEFPSGGKIYSADGVAVGVVADLYFADTTKNVLCVVTEDGEEIPPERVASVSYGVITLLPDGKTRKRTAAPKKIPAAETDVSVSVLSPETEAQEEPVADPTPAFLPEITALPLSEVTAAPAKRTFMPARVIGNYRFLLGRIVVNNIYDKRRMLIIKKGSLITAEVVLTAHAHNKLVELTLNSRL